MKKIIKSLITLSFLLMISICLFIFNENDVNNVESRIAVSNVENNNYFDELNSFQIDESYIRFENVEYQQNKKIKNKEDKKNKVLTENVNFDDESETLQFCNEFVTVVNEELNYYDTSIDNELNKKINSYEEKLENFNLNEKNVEEYQELVAKLENSKEMLDNYNNLLYTPSTTMVVINPNIAVNNVLTDSALLAIYAAALVYFNANGYLLAEELLEHMKTNQSINSSYKPINTQNIKSTQGYKSIISSSSTRSSYNFEKDGTQAGDDAFYALHSVNYNKTNTNSGVVISDRYDYAYDMAYDDFKTDAVCNAMYTLQERGYLTPYYVIIECSECYSYTKTEADVYMSSYSRYFEKTGILGKGDSIQYNFSVSDTSYKTIQTYGPDDTYIRIYDINNNLLVGDDDSGYKLNALVTYLFELGHTYKIDIRMYSSSKVGNIRVGFAPVEVDNFDDITKITKSNGLFTDKYKDINITSSQNYANIFLLENNEEKSFTIETKKNGNSYFDTYLYMIDPRRSNYYDGIGSDDDYHPMYIYNDDGAGNLQAKLNVKYKGFFSKETEFIIISSPYNLSKTGKYTIDINGLDTKHGKLFL